MRKEAEENMSGQNNTRPVTVIIAAAGSGERMGGISKPLMKICGRHMILYSLDMFMSCDFVERVIISAKREEMLLIRELAGRENYMKEILVTEGGKSRQESVTKAFAAGFKGKKKTKFVAVHDAARPLITKEEFTRAFHAAEMYGNAVCAARAKDTFKITDKNNLVTGTVERENLWHIQTPQIFDADMFHTAEALARKTGLEETDESGLVTSAGFLVKLVECGHDNIKITYPEDVLIAEAIIEKRRIADEHERQKEGK